MRRKLKWLMVIGCMIAIVAMISDGVGVLKHWGDFEHYSSFGHTWVVFTGLMIVLISILGLLFTSSPEDIRREQLKKIRQVPYMWR